MEKKDLLYEGKAKKVFKTDDPGLLIVDYKDDATALNGLKRGTIANKGVINNKMSNYLMQMIEKEGIPTHFVGQLSDRETLVRKVTIVPLEVIVRNTATGSLTKRYGIADGTRLKSPVLEFSYKNDELGDPMINDYHIEALGLATKEQVAQIAAYSFKINELLKEFFAGIGVDLIDFKLEFGVTDDGRLILADEISPDTCRFWDIKTGAHLDKDRFRRDMDDVAGGYLEMEKRIFG